VVLQKEVKEEEEGREFAGWTLWPCRLLRVHLLNLQAGF
jgi:hypothetical protein